VFVLKYFFIALLLATLGVAEYVFVEVYPFPETQRSEKFQRLPVVDYVLMIREAKLVEEAFERSDSGFVKLAYNTGSRWYSKEEWLSDRKKGNWGARSLGKGLRQRETWLKDLPSHLEKAKENDLSAIFYVLQGSWFGADDSLTSRAQAMLRDHPSATAKMYVELLFDRSVERGSREATLLYTGSALENWRPPQMEDAQFDEQSKRNEQQVATLLEQAAKGYEDAIWVLDQLKADGLID